MKKSDANYIDVTLKDKYGISTPHEVDSEISESTDVDVFMFGKEKGAKDDGSKTN